MKTASTLKTTPKMKDVLDITWKNIDDSSGAVHKLRPPLSDDTAPHLVSYSTTDPKPENLSAV